MRRLIASTFASLDGIMQAPGGPEEDPTGGLIGCNALAMSMRATFGDDLRMSL